MNTYGKIYVFKLGINKHALPIAITKSREAGFLLMLHQIVNATQVLLCNYRVSLHMVPSPKLKVMSQLLSLKRPLKYALYSSKSNLA
jgi:hypothetical protein